MTTQATLSYQATARNKSVAAMRAAMLAAFPNLDPSVPAGLNLAPFTQSTSGIGSYNAQLDLVYQGTLPPGVTLAQVAQDLTNLYTYELSKRLNTPVRALAPVVT